MQRRGGVTAITTLFLSWRQGESGSWCYNRHGTGGTGGISGKEGVRRGLRGVKMKISMAKDRC
jgi:hypothetical protein